MSAICSHNRFEIIDINPDIHNITFYTFQLAKRKCMDCHLIEKVIQYTGKLTGIKRRWRKVPTQASCNHPKFDIDEKTIVVKRDQTFGLMALMGAAWYDTNKPSGLYIGHGKCIVCEKSLVLKRKYKTRWKDGDKVDIFSETWNIKKT